MVTHAPIPIPRMKNDWLLLLLIKGCDGGESINLTIITHGLVVTGQVIGVVQYFEELAKSSANHAADWTKMADNHKRGVEADGDDYVPRYLHMKKALIFGSPTLDMDTSLFRIDLDSVDGWTIGNANFATT